MINGSSKWIAIESEIVYEIDDSDIYTLQTESKVLEKNNSLYIMYEESDISGMKGDKTLLKIGDNIFSMRRYGKHTSELVFILNKETSSLYQTPQGVFSMICNTKKLIINKEPFKVDVEYELTIDGLVKSNNRLKIYFLDN